MVPILLAINGIIWYGVVKTYQSDRAKGPYPENPQFDYDLDKLWQAAMPTANVNWITCPNGECEVPFIHYYPGMSCKSCTGKLDDKAEDLLIKQDFEAWLMKEQARDKTLEDYLWEEGILNPEEVIWCNGTPLVPNDPDDMKKFLEIKNTAYLEGEYNGKLLEEGGQDDLYRTWFMLKGCSDFGADKLMEAGINPWEFEF